MSGANRTRTSPIDRGNLNRSFPGRPDGTVTEKIADYFQRVLLPLADVVLDFHSGGKTLDFLPFCAAHILPGEGPEVRAQEEQLGAFFDTIVVCTVTGNGLKDPDTALKTMPDVTPIPVDPAAVVAALGLG